MPPLMNQLFVCSIQKPPGSNGIRTEGGRVATPPSDALEGQGTSEAAPEVVRQAVGGGCQSGWGRLLSVTNAIEAGTCRQGDSGEA